MARRRRSTSPLEPIARAPEVRAAAAALVDAALREASERALTPAQYERAVAEVGRLRGRPLLLPALAAGVGRGARVRLADGTTRLDWIGGLGVYAFGHGDRDLLETAVAAAASDVVFQGHLLPGPEYVRISRALLRHAGPRLKHVWLSLSGAIANENALKMVLQKKHPADRILAFEGNFAGRTTTLAEITDKAAYRDGLPLRGNVLLVPWYDPRHADPIGRSVAALDAHLRRHPGQIAAMLFELVQGEGGIRTAPREFFAALMQRCHAAKIAVWADEVQTFARTSEVFAFRTLGLEQWVDVATAGKVLQGSAALFTRELAPRQGLVSGTYAGATVGMAVGTRILERLEEDGYLGPDGRIALLGRRVERRFDALAKRCPEAVSAWEGIGAMHAFVPFGGEAAVADAVLRAAWDEGLLVFTAGASPTRIRLLLPVNTTDEELEAGFAMLEKAIRRVGSERGLAC
ncbi:MAG: acetylornithine aminotransferase [Proteobacteria bacterium]|nr:MAG: acetylornithine aminotransferase [Pseudomonadota bacterium]